MKLRPRMTGLLAVAAASLAFAMFDRGAQIADGVPPKQTGRTQGEAKAPREATAAAPAPQAMNDVAVHGETDLFAAKSWHVAPPPPPPPPKPEAPPFPYTVSGSMSDGEDVTLFLSQGERNFIVKKGDIVGGSYRLDDIADGRAEFIYLPFKQRQYLQIGKIN